MNNRNLLSIGEFSKASGLTVKTVRFYHEQGLLVPTAIDEATGYRYYDPRKLEVARIIGELRKLDFSIAEIAEILRSCEDDADILSALERQQETIQKRMQSDRQIARQLDQLISKEREAQESMTHTSFDIQEKTIDRSLIAGIRMKGRYSECGQAFGRIARAFGRHLSGKAFLLHYDTEYREEDADFEACMPIRKGESTDGISVRELPGGKCVSLVHQGPYDELGRSYAKIFQHIKARGYEVEVPTREVYLKGPGMIFKGNPKKYVTEIQILIKR